ncbi:hypothetical protein BZA77DRAFT_176580 [Pyronema omphalodes]|nr:hypothetical protein BZA77DRAFT_176580 [Pyronema omphalodes]
MISETAYIYWKFREAAQQYDRAEADVRSREEYFKGFPLMQERYQLKIKTATHELQEAKKEWNLRQDNLERGMRNAVKLETERLIEGNLRKVEKYVREVLEAHINSASSRTLISPAEIEILKRDIQALKQQPAMPIIPSSELKELRRELDQLKQRDEQREKQMQELTKQAEARYGKVEAQAKIAQTTQNQIREELDAVKSALQELKKDMPGMQKQIGLNTETINEHKKLQLKVEGLESQHRKTAETVTAVNITFKAIQNQQNQLVAQHDGTQKALENIKKNQTLFIGRQDKIEEQSTATKKAAAAMAEKQEAFNKQVLELKQKQDEFDKRASQISARIDSTPAPVASPPIVTSSFNPSDLAPIIARLKDHIDEITETTLNGVETRFAEITAQISSLNISHTDTATALSTLDGKVNNVFARLQPFINHINGVQISINTLKSQCESLGMGLKHCDDKLSENSTKEFAEKIATLMQQRFPNWFEVGKQIQYLLSSYRAHEAKLTQQLATISQLLNEQNNAKQMQSQLQTETTMLKNLQAQLQNSHAQVIHKVKQLAAERAERQQLANTANDTTNNGASGTSGNNGNVSSNINSAQVTPSPPTPAPAGTLQLTNGANETEAKISRIETEIQQNTTALATLDETFNVFRTDMREFYDGVYAKLEEYYRAIKHLEAQQHSIVTWVEGGSEGAPPIVRTENPEEPTEQVPANNQNSRDGTEEGEIRDEEMQGTVGTNE